MIYPHNMTFEHYQLLLLAILPFYYKFNFWFYVIQLKEYRWDRFKEYLASPQWKTALINIWSVTELPLFLVSFYVFYNEPFEIIIYPVLFYYLLMQNLFVFLKIRKWTVLKPKKTSRLLMIQILLLLIIIQDIWLIHLYEVSNYLYFFIPWIFLFLPFLIFIIVLITLPIVNYKKTKLINKAIEKSKLYNKPIKIWITWSYWKSSVKEFLSSILEQEWKTLKTPENVNTELWVSDLILRELNDEYKYFVAEMWAYRIGEIDLLWKIVNHKYWFLTAIWNQHLWLFGSLENIKKWKSEIINKVIEHDWTLYINWNNQEIRDIIFWKDINVIRYWNFEWSDTNYEILWVKEWNTKFSFEYEWAKSIFTVPLIWEHNIINITWVLAFCYDIWFKTSDLLVYLKHVKAPKNTLSVIKYNNLTLIDDTYNLSEAWLFAWLDALNSFEWTKILVIDDILELWWNAWKIHIEIWKKIAQWNFVNKILFAWVNYKSDFLKWLIEWWFDRTNFISKIDSNISDSVILFEWRNAWKYINNITKNV